MAARLEHMETEAQGLTVTSFETPRHLSSSWVRGLISMKLPRGSSPSAAQGASHFSIKLRVGKSATICSRSPTTSAHRPCIRSSRSRARRAAGYALLTFAKSPSASRRHSRQAAIARAPAFCRPAHRRRANRFWPSTSHIIFSLGVPGLVRREGSRGGMPSSRISRH